MSTLILTLRAVFRDRAGDRDFTTRSHLLRLAGKIYASTLPLKEPSLLSLASRLQFRALAVEGALEDAFASATFATRRAHLALAAKALGQGQDALLHALQQGLLSPEYFLELNAPWDYLAGRVRRHERISSMSCRAAGRAPRDFR